MAGRSSSASPSRGPERVDRRDEIAQAAYALIAAGGIGGLSLRAVARRLGATTGLVNHHFLDRAELVAAALDHATAVMARRVVTAGGPSTHPFELLKQVLPTDDEAIENWRFALSVRTGALVDDDLRRFDDDIAKRWEEQLPALVRPHLSDELARSPKRLREACEHLVLSVDGIALRATLKPADWPAERQHLHLQQAFDAIGVATDNHND